MEEDLIREIAGDEDSFRSAEVNSSDHEDGGSIAQVLRDKEAEIEKKIIRRMNMFDSGESV